MLITAAHFAVGATRNTANRDGRAPAVVRITERTLEALVVKPGTEKRKLHFNMAIVYNREMAQGLGVFTREQLRHVGLVANAVQGTEPKKNSHKDGYKKLKASRIKVVQTGA